jgi:hypothetical protein
VPINEEYFQKRPSLSILFDTLNANEEAIEIYKFIANNRHYTIDRGIGMGADISIAPDMLKLIERAKTKGIDIERYENYCIEFIRRQSKLEQAQ